MSPGDSLAREPAAPRRWLSIVGIGEDGLEGLTAVARGLVKDAEIVFGGKRHLGLAASLIRGARATLAQPVRARGRGGAGLSGAAGLRARLGRPVRLWRRAVLLRHVDPRETVAVPVPSTFSWPPRASAGRCRRYERSRSMAGRWISCARISSRAHGCWR
jgi:precorrin-6Y C5,15-methyltransferase (decarboxylating)